MPEKRPRRRRMNAQEDIEAAFNGVRFHYEALQSTWHLALQGKTTDWQYLTELHKKMAYLERRAPWLKELA